MCRAARQSGRLLSGVIYDSGPPCSDKSNLPCVIQPSTRKRPICEAYTCCPESCGQCGADNCAKLPGGVENCCAGAISGSERKCEGETTSASIIQPSTREWPICETYMYCPESCGRCEGEKCAERPGSVVNYCPGVILESGRRCWGKTTSACII